MRIKTKQKTKNLISEAEKKGKQIGKLIIEISDLFSPEKSLRFLNAVEDQILVMRYFKIKILHSIERAREQMRDGTVPMTHLEVFGNELGHCDSDDYRTLSPQK